MTITPLETAIWDAGILAYVLVICSLLRRRGHLLRAVAAYVAYHFVFTIYVFVFKMRRLDLGPVGYYLDTGVDFVLQVSIVVELAAITLRRGGSLKRVRWYLLIGLTSGAVLATTLALSLSYRGLSNWDTWAMRIDVFTSLFICTCIIGFLALTVRLRLQRGLHVTGVGRALTLWSALALLCNLIDLYTNSTHTRELFQVLDASWVCMIMYWAYVLWQPDRLIQPRFLVSTPA